MCLLPPEIRSARRCPSRTARTVVAPASPLRAARGLFLAAVLRPLVSAPADAVVVIAAPHDGTAAVEVHANFKPRSAPRTARTVIRKRRESAHVDRPYR